MPTTAIIAKHGTCSLRNTSADLSRLQTREARLDAARLELHSFAAEDEHEQQANDADDHATHLREVGH